MPQERMDGSEEGREPEGQGSCTQPIVVLPVVGLLVQAVVRARRRMQVDIGHTEMG